MSAAGSVAIADRFAARGRFFGLIAAVVALAAQIALGAVIVRAPSPQSELASLDAVAVICHTGGVAAGAAAGKALPHRPPGVRLSAIAQAVLQAAGLIGPASFFVPAPSLWARAAARPFSPRAPPSLARLAAQARAPPLA